MSVFDCDYDGDDGDDDAAVCGSWIEAEREAREVVRWAGLGRAENQSGARRRQRQRQRQRSAHSAPSLLRLKTARCSSMRPTRPWPRTLPPPSGLTPLGPFHVGKGPWTCSHQGSFSILLFCSQVLAGGERALRCADDRRCASDLREVK